MMKKVDTFVANIRTDCTIKKWDSIFRVQILEVVDKWDDTMMDLT